MSYNQSILTIAVISVITYLIRSFPFIVFRNKGKDNKVINYLTNVLPYSLIAMLLIYCFKDVKVFGLGVLEALAEGPTLHRDVGRPGAGEPAPETGGGPRRGGARPARPGGAGGLHGGAAVHHPFLQPADHDRRRTRRLPLLPQAPGRCGPGRGRGPHRGARLRRRGRRPAALPGRGGGHDGNPTRRGPGSGGPIRSRGRRRAPRQGRGPRRAEGRASDPAFSLPFRLAGGQGRLGAEGLSEGVSLRVGNAPGRADAQAHPAGRQGAAFLRRAARGARTNRDRGQQGTHSGLRRPQRGGVPPQQRGPRRVLPGSGLAARHAGGGPLGAPHGTQRLHPAHPEPEEHEGARAVGGQLRPDLGDGERHARHPERGIGGNVTLAAVRDATNSSRKFILPVLEYFDSKGYTRRVGDVRVVKGAS